MKHRILGGITMEELIGHKIIKMFIDKDSQEYLVFQCKQRNFVYYVDGECCSESWFADVVSINALLGHTVNSVDEVDMGEINDDRGRQECDEAYGYKLKTTGGYADIVFRNSSNGYYGGSLRLVGDIGEHIKLMELTEDYSA